MSYMNILCIITGRPNIYSLVCVYFPPLKELSFAGFICRMARNVLTFSLYTHKNISDDVIKL